MALVALEGVDAGFALVCWCQTEKGWNSRSRSLCPVCWEFAICLHWGTWNDVALENQYLLVDFFPLSCNGRYLERVGAFVPWIGPVLCLLTDVYQIDGLSLC